ncbi:MAG: thioredoxin family protein [Bacilli bacterium]
MNCSKEKIQNIVIIVLVTLIVLGGAFFVSALNKDSDYVFKASDQNIETPNEEYDEKEMKEHTDILIKQYLSLKKEDKVNIIYVARPTCGYCNTQNPILKNVAFIYNLKVYYLNTDNFTREDNNKFMNSDESFKEGYGTPMVLITKNDKIIDKTPGLVSKEELIKIFKGNKIIVE